MTTYSRLASPETYQLHERAVVQWAIAIGREFLVLRKQRELTQDMLAEVAGVGNRTVARIERGIARTCQPVTFALILQALDKYGRIPDETLKRISRLVGVDVAALMSTDLSKLENQGGIR